MSTVWITNYAQLFRKYGDDAAMAVWNKLGEIAPTDHRVNLANPGTIPFPVVSPALSERGTKEAIDAIYKHFKPEYIAIVGAQDVVAFQTLNNPMPDDDGTVPTDLPYACEASYSKDANNFLGPTRVVGRIPNIFGDSDPAYLLGLLDRIATAKPRPQSDYMKCFSVTADLWRESTRESLDNVFGTGAKLRVSPPEGSGWKPAVLQQLTHFINCHGAKGSAMFYGEGPRGNFSNALAANELVGRISEGAVASTECCYGAELYAPNNSVGGNQHSGICTNFLHNGGYGYFGSSTIAYGPAAGNGAADLITQYFLKYVLEGSSLGRAALQARQDYVQNAGTLDPVDIKTLAQFYLLGAPQIHPVESPGPQPHSAAAGVPKMIPNSLIADDQGREMRRKQLFAKGQALASSLSFGKLSKTLSVGGELAKLLNARARALGLTDLVQMSFRVVEPSFDVGQATGESVASTAAVSGPSSAKGVKAKSAGKRTMHVVIGKNKQASSEQPIENSTVLVLLEQNGQVLSIQEYNRK